MQKFGETIPLVADDANADRAGRGWKAAAVGRQTLKFSVTGKVADNGNILRIVGPDQRASRRRQRRRHGTESASRRLARAGPASATPSLHVTRANRDRTSCPLDLFRNS